MTLRIKFDKGLDLPGGHGFNIGVCWKDRVLTLGLWKWLLHFWLEE